MGFDQFYTYNAEQWYSEEIKCSLCDADEKLDNLQDIIVWASAHMAVCKAYKWYEETRLVFPWETEPNEWHRSPVAVTDDERLLIETKHAAIESYTEIRFVEREF